MKRILSHVNITRFQSKHVLKRVCLLFTTKRVCALVRGGGGVLVLVHGELFAEAEVA